MTENNQPPIKEYNPIPPGLPGRKPTITQEKVDVIFRAIANGLLQKRAYGMVGISSSGYYKWLRKGDALIANEEITDYSTLSEEEQLYVQLVHAVEIAESYFMNHGIQEILKEGPAGYKWVLSRLFRKELGDSMNIETDLNIREIQLELPGIAKPKIE